jgi:hypothetical protein
MADEKQRFALLISVMMHGASESLDRAIDSVKNVALSTGGTDFRLRLLIGYLRIKLLARVL